MNLNQERLAKLRSLVGNFTGGVSIIISQVDPDALGAARAFMQLISHLRPKNGLEVKMFYGGAISHPQNQTVINRYDLAKKLKPMKTFTAQDNTNVVLVDSSSLADGRLCLNPEIRIDPVIVIDHHRGSDVAEHENTFVWIEDVGAASTLMTELLVAAGVEFNETNHVVAVLLALGIHTDTGSLTDCGPRDRDAYNIVTNSVPNQELSQLFRYPLPTSHFHNVKKALGNMEIRDGKLVTHIGKIQPNEGDDLSSISDDLIRMNSVTLVIVWGIIDRTVRISARNADISNPLDLFLRDRFPGASCGAKLSANGQGIGGGTISIDIGQWMIPETVSEVESLVSKWVQTQVFLK